MPVPLGIVASGVQGIIDPLSLSPALWLKADAITGLNDGDAVATWPDSSGNSRDAAQGTAGRRPLYRASAIGGIPGVDFDGSDDYLDTPAYTNGTRTAVFVVFVPDAVGTTVKHLALHGSGGGWSSPHARWCLRGDSTATEWGAWVESSAVPISNTTPAWGAGTPYIMDLFYDGANVVGKQNGAQFGTRTRTADVTGTSDVVRLGANMTPGEYFNGKICEVIAYESLLTAQNVTDVRNYLAAKYGISV